MNANKTLWTLVDLKGNEFEELCIVLDNIMKEHTQIGASYEYEEELWDRHLLGKDTPNKPCNTVLFVLSIHLALRSIIFSAEMFLVVTLNCLLREIKIT